MTSTLTAETIAELTRDIWTSLLLDEGALIIGELLHGGDVAATIDISGAWNGTACLNCSGVAARHAAAVMFGTDDADLSGDDITDAVGELINVVGGNIKRLLPGPTELSLPSVRAAADVVVRGDLKLAQEVKFSWMDEPVVVSVWSSEE